MGKEEILKLLKKKKKWMSAREIYECGGMSNLQNITKHLSKLFNSGEITKKDRKIIRIKKINVYMVK